MMKVKDIARRTLIYDMLRHCATLQENRIWHRERKRFLLEAQKEFSAKKLPGSLKDYVAALDRHRVTFSEYMYKFEYWKLNEEERDEFISCSQMQCIYRKMVTPNVRNIFFNKVLFLQAFSNYIHRKWLRVKDSSFEEFEQMIESNESCIAKPIKGTRGDGIFKIEKNSLCDKKTLYIRCVDDDILLEECIHAHHEIEAFHPKSLNTIRVVTISNNERSVVFGALLRMGAGDSFVDNTHSGGVFASIDIKTGIIDTDGIDSEGNHYVSHPDTNIKIKGFQIPYWEEVLKACDAATRVVPNTIFSGWDVCVLEDGTIEFIEGNHAPDFDGGMQAPHKIGVKKKIQTVVQELYDTDPLKLISIKSKTLNKYTFFDK